MPKNGETTFDVQPNYIQCKMYWDGHWFIGYSKCLDQDKDMWSEITGKTLCEIKANIKRLKYILHQEQQKLKTLINFQKSLACCKKYNEKSFEAKRLRKEIWNYSNNVKEIKNAIADEQLYLQKYILQKDRIYRRVREKNK